MACMPSGIGGDVEACVRVCVAGGVLYAEMDRELEDMERGVGGVGEDRCRCPSSLLSWLCRFLQHMSVWLGCARTPLSCNAGSWAVWFMWGPLFHCAYTGKSPVYTRIAWKMRSVTTFFSLAAYASVEPGSLWAPNDAQCRPAASQLLAHSHYLQYLSQKHSYWIYTTIKKENSC